MPLNPLTGLEEEVDPITGQPVSMPAAKPDIQDYIKKKFNLGEYSDENRQKLVDQSKEYDTTGAIQGALASLGAAFQGGNSVQAVNQVMNQRQANKDRMLSEFDKGRAGKVQTLGMERDAEKYGREEALLAKESDPNSIESKMAQDLARSMGYKGDTQGMTAAQFKAFSPIMQKKYEIEQKKLDRAETRTTQQIDKQNKLDEKMQKMQTPYGLANSEDDAKKLKDAHESKQIFDRKIQEMIDLRNEYGTEYANREAVARGKQLSKDLLLEYKNMAKLGVLSQADEAIINAIIPEDPLGQDWAPGQDPILSNLTKFKEDSEKDFTTRVQTRTRDGGAQMAKTKSEEKPKKNIVKTQTNKKTGEKRVVYDDGSVETVSSVAQKGR